MLEVFKIAYTKILKMHILVDTNSIQTVLTPHFNIDNLAFFCYLKQFSSNAHPDVGNNHRIPGRPERVIPI